MPNRAGTTPHVSERAPGAHLRGGAALRRQICVQPADAPLKKTIPTKERDGDLEEEEGSGDTVGGSTSSHERRSMGPRRLPLPPVRPSADSSPSSSSSASVSFSSFAAPGRRHGHDDDDDVRCLLIGGHVIKRRIEFADGRTVALTRRTRKAAPLRDVRSPTIMVAPSKEGRRYR